MSENDILCLLQQKFHRTYIYADEYQKLPSHIGIVAFMDLRSFCGGDIRAWLDSHDMYRDIERDMRPGTGCFDPAMPIDEAAGQILEEFPLIGEAVLPEEMQNRLFERAQQVFDEILAHGDKDLTASERDVMILAIVQHLKRRSLQDADKDEGQIWSYIYNQFGFKAEQETYRQRVYTTLCRIVREALLQHARFFSERENTQKYYNTLNLHAMIPVKSMESLFDILLSFYIHDLEFRYVPGDPAFSTLCKCIAYRWDRDIEVQEDLNVRSNPMASSLRTLFMDRPCFMRNFCERIVRLLGALVRGNDELLTNQNTLGILMRNWYARKDRYVHDDLRRNRQSAGENRRIFASAEMQHIHYVLENRRVCLFVPSIRLGEKADDYPQMGIFQQGICIASRAMEVFGRFSWTTHPIQIALEDLNIDFNAPLELSIQIEYDRKPFLDSGNKLYRPFILFNENGQETAAQSSLWGTCYIFANELARIDADGTNISWLDHPGQLMRLYLCEDAEICINDEPIFASQDKKNVIRLYPSIPKAEHLSGSYEGNVFPIYREGFTLKIHLPEERNVLSYKIETDGEMEPLDHYRSLQKNICSLKAPSEPVKMHLIRIVDVETGRISCTFRYAVLPGVTVKIDRAILYDDGEPVKVRVAYAGCLISTMGFPEEGTRTISIPAEHLAYDLKAEIPLIFGELAGQNVFGLDAVIWHERLADAAFVKLCCPDGWTCRLGLGEKTVIPQNAVDGAFEIGNFLRSYKTENRSEQLSLAVKTPQGDQSVRILAEIVFEEYFTESPVSIKGQALVWAPEEKYIGSDADQFKLEIDVPREDGPYVYALDMKDAVVSKLLFQDFPYGEFPYRIMKCSNGLFSKHKERQLWEGVLTLGEPEQWRLDGKALYLKRARCWDINTNQIIALDMPETAGCLIDFSYMGYSVPAGEEISYPEYEATLYFYDQKGERWLPFNDREKEGFERVNPVRIWIVSPKLLMLVTVDGDAVILDRNYNSILNRTLALPKEIERCRLILPDYFEYSEG